MDYLSKEKTKLLVDMLYLDKGLIHPSRYLYLEEIGALNIMLSSLSDEDAKKSKRKFRKILRKILKEKIRKRSNVQNVKTNSQKQTLVYNQILKEIYNNNKSIKDVDDENNS